MESYDLTATAIAEKMGMKPSLVNKALISIGFLRQDDKGYFSTNIVGETIKGKQGKTFVKWNKLILINKLFLESLKAATESSMAQKDSIKETSKKDYQLSNYESIIRHEIKNKEEQSKTKPADYKNKKQFKKPVNHAQKVKAFRGAFPSNIRSETGHELRSYREAAVANWLYNHYFSFSSEKRLPLGADETVYSDFFLNKDGIYIEVWGMQDEKYLARKRKKIEIYKKHGFKLISLEDDDMENLDDVLPIKLAEFGVKLY